MTNLQVTRCAGLSFAAVVLLLPADLQADGCILGKGGKYIPEKEQRAFITWEAGQERLYVATRADASQEASLWIIPVPADPAHVKAEPVEKFPSVGLTLSVADAASTRLQEIRTAALLLDSGFNPLLIWPLGKSAAMTFGSVASGVEVHQHIERLGMVVEVVTAKSTAALDAYLSQKQLGVSAAQVAALAPYLEKPYTFICAWLAGPGQKLQARALQIDFPSPTIYYPLRPTSVYTNDIATSIFIRGWARPRAGQAAAVSCEYVRARVTESGLPFLALPGAGAENLTRVHLGKSPRGWTEDLELEPGAPCAIQVAEVINALGIWMTLPVCALVGLVLASFLPWAVVPAAERSWRDWLWAWAVGAATALTLYAPTLLFFAWRYPHHASAGRPLQLAKTALAVAGVAGLVLVIFLLALVQPRHAWVEAAAVLLVVFLMAAIPLAVLLVVAALRSPAGWLLVFMTLHAATVIVLSLCLEKWLANYL